MDAERFRNSPVGDVIPVSVYDRRDDQQYNHFAFRARPLGHRIELSDGTIQAAMDASHALGRLDQAAAQLPNPRLFIRPAIRKEAVSTSALEGTFAGIAEIFEAELREDASLTGDVREVMNYVRAAERGVELLRSRPIGVNLLNTLQRTLVSGTRGDSYQAGGLRQEQVWIGRRDARITAARFVPCPHGDDLVKGVSDWEKWIHGIDEHGSDHDTPLLVRLAVGHYQFETLHPYNDGNGRLGRLLIVLQLIEEKILRDPVLYVSPYFEARRDEYVDHLRRVSETGDFDPWVNFFSKAVATQAADASTRMGQVFNERDAIVAELRSKKVRGVAIEIAENLIGFPIITPSQAAGAHGVSYQAANNAVGRLVDAGVLVELTGRTWGRVFAAPRLMRLLEVR